MNCMKFKIELLKSDLIKQNIKDRCRGQDLISMASGKIVAKILNYVIKTNHCGVMQIVL